MPHTDRRGTLRGLDRIAADQCVHVETGSLERPNVGEATKPGPHDDGTDAHAGIPAAFATIDSIVY
jgi:hypothetical protein